MSQPNTPKSKPGTVVRVSEGKKADRPDLGKAQPIYTENVVSVQTDEKDTEPVEDPTPRMLREVLYGNAVVDIARLENRWNAYDENATANRSLDMKHAMTIAKSMKVTKRNADAPQRICITMSLEQIEASLLETAIESEYSGAGRRKWYERHKDDADVRGKIEKAMDENRAKIEAKVDGKEISDYPWLRFPADMDKPILNRGQHRQKAHELAFPEYKGMKLNKDTVKKIGWACDIVLEELLTPDLTNAIRQNKEDIYKSNSDGDIYLSLANQISQKDPKPDAAEFASLVHAKVGAGASNIQRLKTVLKDHYYSEIARRICQTAWGRKDFVLEHFDMLCTSKIPTSNAETLYHIIERNRVCFGGHADFVEDADLRMIQALPMDRKTHGDALRQLFFPKTDDGPAALGTMKLQDFQKPESKYDGPRANNRYSHLGTPFEYRRPGFLRFCPGKTYMETFEWLYGCKNLPVYNYVTVHREIEVGLVLFYLLGHVIFWANPTYLPPYRTSIEAKAGYDFQNVVRDVYTDEPAEDETHVAEYNKANDERTEKARVFVKEVRGYVRENFAEWDKIKRQDLHIHYPPNVEKLIFSPTLKERREYRARFANNSLWLELLKMTAKAFGYGRFKGLMHRYNVAENMTQLTVRERRLEERLTDFLRDLNRHGAEFCNLYKSEFYARVAMGAAIAVEAYEAEQIRVELKRYEELAARGEAAASTGGLNPHRMKPIENEAEAQSARDVLWKLEQVLIDKGHPLSHPVADTANPFGPVTIEFDEIEMPGTSLQAQLLEDEASEAEWKQHKPEGMEPKKGKARTTGGGSYKSPDFIINSDAEEDGDVAPARKRKNRGQTEKRPAKRQRKGDKANKADTTGPDWAIQPINARLSPLATTFPSPTINSTPPEPVSLVHPQGPPDFQPAMFPPAHKTGTRSPPHLSDTDSSLSPERSVTVSPLHDTAPFASIARDQSPNSRYNLRERKQPCYTT